jgi:hypothetical protein
MAEIGALFDSMFIGTTAGITFQKWQNSLLGRMTYCTFHILVTAPIEEDLTSRYLVLLKPPSRQPNSKNPSNFWMESRNFWTQDRSRNSGRFLMNGWRGRDGSLRTKGFTTKSDQDKCPRNFEFRLLDIRRNCLLSPWSSLKNLHRRDKVRKMVVIGYIISFPLTWSVPARTRWSMRIGETIQYGADRSKGESGETAGGLAWRQVICALSPWQMKAVIVWYSIWGWFTTDNNRGNWGSEFEVCQGSWIRWTLG